MQKVIWFDELSKNTFNDGLVEFLMDLKLCLQNMNNLGIPFIDRSKAMGYGEKTLINIHKLYG